MRGRGLKPCQDAWRRGFELVAPHAGAWIETIPEISTKILRPVAPHAGAWIETDKPS